MNEELLRRVAYDLSEDTADCPTLALRVSVGARARRRRYRSAAGGLAAFVIAGPALFLALQFHSGGDQSVDAGPSLSCLHTADSSRCGLILSERAELALKRANSPIRRGAEAEVGCVHRPYCRGPV